MNASAAFRIVDSVSPRCVLTNRSYGQPRCVGQCALNLTRTLKAGYPNRQLFACMLEGARASMRTLIAIAVAVSVAVSPGRGVASSASQYAIVPVDPPAGFAHTVPTDINREGEIVGNALTAGNAIQHAFAWYGGTSTDLGTLGGTASSARSVNDAGLVAGDASSGGEDDEVHAVVWDAGYTRDLGEPGRVSGAYSVNAHGLVVGYERDHLGTNHAVLWDNGITRRLDRFTMGFSNAVSINSAGQVLLTGVPTGAGGSPESFIWEGGPLTGVGPIEGTALNLWGDVVGYRAGPILDLQGVFWQDGSLRPINGPSGEPALPLGMNDSGEVVGWMGRTQESERAFLWDNGEIVDLNERITVDSGWQLLRATAINDSGQIVGCGLLEGRQAGFLLTPK
jgi:probable HAF family extracellular repeat protein